MPYPRRYMSRLDHESSYKENNGRGEGNFVNFWECGLHVVCIKYKVTYVLAKSGFFCMKKPSCNYPTPPTRKLPKAYRRFNVAIPIAHETKTMCCYTRLRANDVDRKLRASSDKRVWCTMFGFNLFFVPSRRCL